MSWNQFCYISLCNTLTKTFRLKLLALFPRRPKRDQNETCTISFKLKGLALFLIRKLPICRNVRTGTSFLYLLDWKSKHFNWNVTEWKFTQSSLIFKSFQEEIESRGKFHTNPYNFVAKCDWYVLCQSANNIQ